LASYRSIEPKQNNFLLYNSREFIVANLINYRIVLDLSQLCGNQLFAFRCSNEDDTELLQFCKTDLIDLEKERFSVSFDLRGTFSIQDLTVSDLFSFIIVIFRQVIVVGRKMDGIFRSLYYPSIPISLFEKKSVLQVMVESVQFLLTKIIF
jgi:hypothetical protein